MFRDVIPRFNQLFIAGAIGGLMILVILAGPMLGEEFWRMSSAPSPEEELLARSFCEQLVPLLEDFHVKNRAYPTDITVILPIDSSLPHLLKFNWFWGPSWYESDGMGYKFKIPTSNPLNCTDLWLRDGQKVEGKLWWDQSCS